MNLAVIGATGYVGDAVVRELAARGHNITAFARNPAKVLAAANVRAVAADVTAADFAAQLAGFDAVVSAFNPGWTNPHIGRDFRAGYAAILAAAKTAQVPYLLIVGGAGSLYVAPGLQVIDTPEFPKEIYDGANAARDLLTELRGRNDLNWAFISPPAMFSDPDSTNMPRTGTYRTGKDDVLMDGDQPANISLGDLAAAIADDVEKKAHLHQRFTVASV